MNKKIKLLFFIIFTASVFCLYSQERLPAESLLVELNNTYRSETLSNFNYAMVSECIAVLMEQGDSSSYPALFSVLTSGYPEIIESEAIGALDIIPGNLHTFLLGVIENNPPNEKFVAFRTGINSQKLSVSERGQLAEHALEKSFLFTENDADMTALRYMSILALTNLEWKRASALVIRHYYRVRADYLQNKAPKDRFIDAIVCMGAVGDSDAAIILGLQLGLINARKERNGDFDPEITIAIINALGNIGDSAAFDNLLFASNLPYDDYITSAAVEAISRLKW